MLHAGRTTLALYTYLPRNQNLVQAITPILFEIIWYYLVPTYIRPGGAKVLCILHHWGVQLISAYSWARPAILVVGKGRGGNVFISSVSSLSFLFLFLPCPSLSSPLLSLLSLFSLSLGDDTKWPSRVDVSLNPNTISHISGQVRVSHARRTISLFFFQVNSPEWSSKPNSCAFHNF